MTAFKIGLSAVAVFSLGLGLWLVKRPRQAIEMQIAFYKRINWRMEPMDWDREILNTRIMGAVALLCGLGMAGLAMKNA